MTGREDPIPKHSFAIGGHHESIIDAFRLKSLVVLLGTAIGLYLCYRLSLPFLSALTWALVLAIMLSPVHRWLEARKLVADSCTLAVKPTMVRRKASDLRTASSSSTTWTT